MEKGAHTINKSQILIGKQIHLSEEETRDREKWI